MGEPLPIAIVAAAGRFPDASDLKTLWQNVLACRTAARPLPSSRDLAAPDAARLDMRKGQPDGRVSNVACLLDEPADPASPDPVSRLVLAVGIEAFRAANLDAVDRSRVGVVLANIALPTDAASHFGRSLWTRALACDLGLSGSSATADVVAPSHDVTSTSRPASELARALGLGGAAFSLDAACASSLYALHLACEELRAGRLDAVLAGGVSRPSAVYTQVGFSQLQALSPSGQCAPFDTRADGLVVGEGAALFVLQRLDDVADPAQILGVICAVGVSNDVGGSLVSPDSEGQLRAMRAAYAQAGWSPADVDLVECHGTGTPRGDATELASLTELFRADPRPTPCTVGSVKSNVGHLLTAAGAVALSKVLMALASRTLPPTAGFAVATAATGLGGGTLRALETPSPWPNPPRDRPRRAAVSAFGFGGINAHMLVEEAPASRPVRPAPRVSARGTEPRIARVAIVGMGAHFGALTSLGAFQQAAFRGEPAFRRRPPARWRAAETSLGDAGLGEPMVGAWVDAVDVVASRFRIPPRELPSLLAQQLLFLKVAAEAVDGLRSPAFAQPLRAGVVVGIGLDLETTSFHLRWGLREQVQRWNTSEGLDLTPSEQDTWAEELAAYFGPELDAPRTLGALGGLVASRLSRELRLGGPSFTVSEDEASGLRAVEVAVRLLQRGEVDTMLAGAIDLAGDLRHVFARDAVSPFSRRGQALPYTRGADGPVVGEGAAAVVLKRLDDALRDGDTIYATLAGFGSSRSPEAGKAYAAALARALSEAGSAGRALGLALGHGACEPRDDRAELEALRGAVGEQERTCAVASATSVVGYAGAASGMASLVLGALSIHHGVLPPLAGADDTLETVAGPLHVAPHAAPWLRDRADGPRRASVASRTSAGTSWHVVLEGVSPPGEPSVTSSALGPREAALFIVRGADVDDLAGQLERLRELATSAPADAAIEALASRHHQTCRVSSAVSGPRGPSGGLTLAYVARDVPELRAQLASPRAPRPALGGGVAFVFPGSGNHYVGMGRELGLAFPHVVAALDAETESLAGQMMPTLVSPRRERWPSGWEGDSARGFGAEPARTILAQVAHGVMVHDVVSSFGVRPQAMLGYSLGESAALFASRTWRARHTMFQRVLESPLFRTELAGTYELARRTWGEAPTWHVVVLNRPAARVRAALVGTAALLIVNAPEECVVGGRRVDVEATVAALGCEAVAVDDVPAVHLPMVQAVAEAYRALHLLPTTPPEGLHIYSAAWARPYAVTSELAAESVLASAVSGFDFPNVVERAYADGVRVFVEMGPQNSCTRMIGHILAGQPHVAVSACSRGSSAVLSVLHAVAKIAEAGGNVDLEPFYGRAAMPEPPPGAPRVTVALGGKPTRPSVPARAAPELSRPASVGVVEEQPSWLVAGVLAAAEARASAHETFLTFARRARELQVALLAQHPQPAAQVAFDRAACLTFARGSLGEVLGGAFASVDQHPTRVRLPDEPLMLVDRILTVEGERGRPGPGRVVTEHDVLPGAWYLDGGRAPVCISVEAGQADLFLSAYLGIDFETRGERVYRLLDAKIVFHRDLPVAGETVRYDIRIDRFIQQGGTWLFFFRFDGTIGGVPFITMFEGCAGFFTLAQLEDGRGIVATGDERLPPRRTTREGDATAAFEALAPPSVGTERCDEGALAALRRGDLAGCFGSAFAGQTLPESLRLPGGRMTLVHRIVALETGGGRAGLGLVMGEADVAPTDWYLTCHFVDDPVMPGTLMYECCQHTLRVLLARLGWSPVGAGEHVHFAPVEGVASRLRCRGQVSPTTRTVRYRIEITEMGYDPEPYALAVASMFADGQHVVEMESMSIRLVGVRREDVETVWREPTPKPPLHDGRRVLAYAVGKPSEAFGPPYAVFDEGPRKLARLPGPPFLFVDRVERCEAPAWELAPGGWATCSYDVPKDAWYFAANRQPTMPHAVLLEAALQPCGWLAAYVGSALAADEDVCFRNLDGAAEVFREVTPDAGTLTTRARLTKTSRAGGMILQEFDFEVSAGGARVFAGTTGFGFFPHRALAEQVGLRGRVPALAVGPGFELPRLLPRTPDDAAPRVASGLELPGQAFSMIDHVDCLELHGGAKGFGRVVGTKRVDPAEWFFAAHFLGDPVMPGSLGLEALLQLLKVYARERFPRLQRTHRFQALALDARHSWSYRGQVVPTAKSVRVEVDITRVVEGESPQLVGSGSLWVDGKAIYSMTDFALRLVPGGP